MNMLVTACLCTRLQKQMVSPALAKGYPVVRQQTSEPEERTVAMREDDACYTKVCKFSHAADMLNSIDKWQEVHRHLLSVMEDMQQQ